MMRVCADRQHNTLGRCVCVQHKGCIVLCCAWVCRGEVRRPVRWVSHCVLPAGPWRSPWALPSCRRVVASSSGALWVGGLPSGRVWAHRARKERNMSSQLSQDGGQSRLIKPLLVSEPRRDRDLEIGAYYTSGEKTGYLSRPYLCRDVLWGVALGQIRCTGPIPRHKR